MQEIMVVGHVCVGSTWQGDDKSLQGAGPNRLDRRQGHARLVAVVPLESLATSMVTCMLAKRWCGMDDLSRCGLIPPPTMPLPPPPPG